jgi:hypothetical protein
MTDKLAHQKDVQGALSLTGATLGLGALGSKGASLAIDHAAKKPLGAHAKPRMVLTPKVARALDKGSIGLVTLGAGVGGISGYNFAAIQRAEAKRERADVNKAETATKPKKKPLTAAERKERKGAMIGGAVTGTAAAAAAPLFSETTRRPAAKASRDRWGYTYRSEGIGRAASDYLKDKARPRGGRAADPGRPASPGSPPTYEERLKPPATPKQQAKFNDWGEKVKYFQEHPENYSGQSTSAEREAFENAREKARQKYGSERGAQIHPGTPGDPGRPARPGIPPKKAPWGWRAAHATMGGPKRTSAIMGAGLLAAGAGVGAAFGVQAARNARQERKERKIMFGKSAFGVSKAEDPYEKYNRAHDAGHRPKPFGEAAPNDWKSDLNRQPAPPKPAPRSYPKTGGIDPERKRLKRMGRWESAAATGSVAAAGTAAAALGARPAADKIKVKAEAKHEEVYNRAYRRSPGMPNKTRTSYKGKRITSAQRQKWYKQRVRLRQISTNADKASTYLKGKPTGKIALGAAAASAGLAGGAVAIREYRKKNGRSYTDWWDG